MEERLTAENLPADQFGRAADIGFGVGWYAPSAVMAGHCDDREQQMLDGTARRSLLIDAIVDGRVRDDCVLDAIASTLRLPKDGPFVVIAAKVRLDGREPLTAIEAKLPSLDVCSAWQLVPDWQVGIVHVKSEHHLDRIIELVSRMAVDRVGMSARFNDLRETPRAVHFAKMMLRGLPTSDGPVAMFDGTIAATAALAAPAIMVESAGIVLAGFFDLPDDERDMLFETFQVWLETDASLAACAETLCCHTNTVRYRLRRIEKRTGLSLSRPRDVVELCLAIEVHRRLM